MKLLEPDLSLARLSPIDLEGRLGELATAVGRQFECQQRMIATAESCTGGMIARALTDTAGSSAWFDSGFVTYSNQAKMRMLGVPQALIDEHGAVSESVAAAMARGALANSLADLSMAVTGVAGPGGGSAEKPVGTVWFGWAGPRDGARAGVHTRVVHFDGGRGAVRLQTAVFALAQLAHLWGDG